MKFLNDPQSPVWNIVRMGVVLSVSVGFLTFGYTHGWVLKDFNTVAGIGVSLGLFDYLKREFVKPGDDK